jgi:hypothetical protein
MGHIISIAEEAKEPPLSKMHSCAEQEKYVEKICCPRITNFQLKYIFYRLHASILATFLNKLQQFIMSSKGCDKWVSAFIAVLGLAMAQEEMQKWSLSMRLTTMHKRGFMMATVVCGNIDNRFDFVQQLFRAKYNYKKNPLRDAELNWEDKIGFGDRNSLRFVRSVASLVNCNSKFSFHNSEYSGGVKFY